MSERSALLRKHFGTDDPDKVKELIENAEVDEDLDVHQLVKMPWPYYAPDDSLPPIPTPEDIERKRPMDYLMHHWRANTCWKHVYRIDSVYAVKFSTSNSIALEAENLLFLQEHDIRTPKVYAAFSHRGADPLALTDKEFRPRKPRERSSLPTYHYVVMDYIDGQTLDNDSVEAMERRAQEKIYRKIGEQIKLLRSIPAPNPSYYGRVHHQGYASNQQILMCDRFKSLVGPFDTYRAFLDHMKLVFESRALKRLLRHRRLELDTAMKLFLAEYDDMFDASSARAADPKLSHMDLKLENIILTPPPSLPSSPAPPNVEDWDVVIIDWEGLSWLPAWAEMASIGLKGPCIKDEPLWSLWQLYQVIKPRYYHEVYAYGSGCKYLGGIL